MKMGLTVKVVVDVDDADADRIQEMGVTDAEMLKALNGKGKFRIEDQREVDESEDGEREFLEEG